MILFLKCNYCGRHPDTPHSTCRGCGAPLKPYPEPFFKVPDPDPHSWVGEVEMYNPAYDPTAGGVRSIEPNPEPVFKKAINRIAGSMVTTGEAAVEISGDVEEFDSAIRRWLGD